MIQHPAIDLLMRVLPEFEGNIPHFYLDTKGLVTCGIGHLLATSIDAHSVEFDPNCDATALAIEEEFARIKSCPLGKSAEFYRTAAKLTLAEGWAERDCATRLRDEFLPGVQSIFLGFDTFPYTVQAALLDMAYNLGVSGLRHWRKLAVACEARQWAAAKQEAHRLGIADARNAWTAHQFTEASA